MITSFLSIILLVVRVRFVFGTECNDEGECYGQTITDYAYCTGDTACRLATITTGTDGVNCAGFYSCVSATEISSSSIVQCYGISSCWKAGSITGYNIECTAFNSCGDITGAISATNDVQCLSKYSCASTTIKAGNDVYCNGDLSCVNTDIIAHDYVHVYGRHGAEGATISAEIVYVYGYYGTKSAIMDSTDELSMNVYQYGYHSGINATFICRSGSTCTLFCMGNGCEGMDFVCEQGATCSMECSVRDIGIGHCPTLTTPDSFPLFKDLKNREKQFDHYFDLEHRGFDFYSAINNNKVVLIILIVAIALTVVHCIKSKELNQYKI